MLSDGTLLAVMQRLLTNCNAAVEPDKEQLMTDSSENENSPLEKCAVCQAGILSLIFVVCDICYE